MNVALTLRTPIYRVISYGPSSFCPDLYTCINTEQEAGKMFLSAVTNHPKRGRNRTNADAIRTQTCCD